jgi:hypothetical protein
MRGIAATTTTTTTIADVRTDIDTTATTTTCPSIITATTDDQISTATFSLDNDDEAATIALFPNHYSSMEEGDFGGRRYVVPVRHTTSSIGVDNGEDSGQQDGGYKGNEISISDDDECSTIIRSSCSSNGDRRNNSVEQPMEPAA